MRLFEVFLYLSVAVLLLPLPIKSIKERNRLFIAGILVVFSLVHIIFEGLRWQMGLCYFIITVIILKYVFNSRRSGSSSFPEHRLIQPGKKIHAVRKILFILLLMLSFVLSMVLPVFKAPVPTGKYPLGTLPLYIIDTSRHDIYPAGTTAQRELMLRIWYPAQKSAGLKKENFIPNLIELTPMLSREYKVPSFTLDYLKYIKSNSYINAPISKDAPKYPVIILSHGLGSAMEFHTNQAENLASHGYVVIAVNHSYGSLASLFPDGRATFYKAGIPYNKLTAEEANKRRDDLGKTWVTDIRFVLDYLVDLESGKAGKQFEGVLDLSRIGVIGHSFGGAAAIQAYLDDPRVKAAVNMDGSLLGPTIESRVRKPVLMLLGEDHYKIRNKDTALALLREQKASESEMKEVLEGIKPENDAIENTLNFGGKLLYLKGSKHYDFTNLSLFTPAAGMVGMTGSLWNQKYMNTVNELVLEYFNVHLKNVPSKLLDAPQNQYPDVLLIKKFSD